MTTHDVDFYLSARDTWFQSFQVMGAIKEGKTGHVEWPRDLFLTTEDGAPGLTIKFPESLTPEALQDWAQNAMIATFGMFAMAADGALEAAYTGLGTRLDDPDGDRRNLRCIWYMIRCAFAHPSAGVPTWECRGKYQSRFTLPGSFTLDGALLHSQPFSIGQLGGWHHVYVLLTSTDNTLGVVTSPNGKQ